MPLLARQPIKVYDLQSVEVLREFGEGFEGATEICTFRFLSLKSSPFSLSSPYTLVGFFPSQIRENGRP